MINREESVSPLTSQHVLSLQQGIAMGPSKLQRVQIGVVKEPPGAQRAGAKVKVLVPSYLLSAEVAEIYVTHRARHLVTAFRLLNCSVASWETEPSAEQGGGGVSDFRFGGGKRRERKNAPGHIFTPSLCIDFDVSYSCLASSSLRKSCCLRVMLVPAARTSFCAFSSAFNLAETP